MELKKYRDQLNDIDDEILALLQKRADIAKQVGSVKAGAGVEIYSPQREREIRNRLKAQNGGKFPEAALEKIWTEIFSASRALQTPERISFLGPIGSFGHAASLTHFGTSAQMLPITPQTDIFTEVETGRADYGVVAIENSLRGIVRDVLERFQDTPLKICAEIFQPIRHHLISKSPLTEIQRIYSHPQPFAQCRMWLNQFMKTVEQAEVVSTSKAAQLAANEPNTAAIASELASDIYHVPIVADSIMDEPNNTTRFLVIGTQTANRSEDDFTSFFFSVKHKVGALYEVLGVLQKYQRNLSYIVSLPSRSKAWEYVFFVDMNGHIEDEPVAAALDQLKTVCQDVKILGSYPRGTIN